MDTNETAKQLLASSYITSVTRIRAAMQGSLTIQNSREPNTPPSFPKEIVGLCGQSGRHPYFRIQVNVLNAALDRIERAAMLVDDSSIDLAMEEITAACQDLRQQTYFDVGTGCANDKLPSMVPLLPPEEIWLDGRELPMDIWRLICFEFDLVSSSVSSETSVEDFAFSAVNQSALAFRFLINQLGNRRVNFEVVLNNVPAGWSSYGAKPTSVDVSLARIFFEAGSLLTPLANESFIKWYGAIRYLHWIDGGSSELRVKDDFKKDTVDCRYRGLFAEETAIGLMAIVLNDVFGARPISNTVEIIPRDLLESGQPIADFIVPATQPGSSQVTTIIAESKGSLGNLVSPARHVRAKQQLAATKKVMFTGSNQTLLLTFGSTIRFSRQRPKSRCIVTDPPADFGLDLIEINPVDAWRVAYTKALKFVGLETAAQQVLRGSPAEALRPIDFDRQRDRRRNDRDRQRLRRAESARQHFRMDLLLDVGQYALGLDMDVLAVLQDGINRESHLKLSEILDHRSERARSTLQGDSFETSLGIGCISYSDLDRAGGQDNTPEG